MGDIAISATAGNYRILSKIADGGMGAVYRAEHVLIGRPVAIKVLLPEFTANRDIVLRFFNEAKATSAIHHPGIVEIFDFGYLDSGLAYIVMELLEGATLGQRIKQRGMMTEGDAAALLRGVCGALAAAHDKGIVHRDLKPDNIFLVADADNPGAERVKLLDFGVAKLTDFGAAATTTKTGMMMGTPTYMSPEQCRGAGDVDQRADLYALGCIFYQLVVGRPPFASNGAGEVIGMHLFRDPDPPSQYLPSISAETEALIMRLLEKEPANRPQTARELANELQAIAFAHGVPGSVPPTQWSHPALRTVAPTPLHVPAVTQRPSAPAPRRKLAIGIAVVVVAAAVGAATFFVYKQRDAGSSASSPTASPPAQAIAAPAVTAPAPAVPTPATSVATPPPAAVVTAPAPTPPAPPPVATAATPDVATPAAANHAKPLKKTKRDRPDGKRAKSDSPDGSSSDLPIETSIE